MESLTQWTWVWAGSGRWWRTGKPGMLQSMGLQRAGHDWMTEQQQQCAKHSTGCRGYRAHYDVITKEVLQSNGGDRQERGHVRWWRCHENKVQGPELLSQRGLGKLQRGGDLWVASWRKKRGFKSEKGGGAVPSVLRFRSLLLWS